MSKVRLKQSDAIGCKQLPYTEEDEWWTSDGRDRGMHSLMVSEPRKTGNDFEHPRLADPGQGQLVLFPAPTNCPWVSDLRGWILSWTIKILEIANFTFFHPKKRCSNICCRSRDLPMLNIHQIPKKFSPKFLIDIFAKICQKDACISGDWVTFRETPG